MNDQTKAIYKLTATFNSEENQISMSIIDDIKTLMKQYGLQPCIVTVSANNNSSSSSSNFLSQPVQKVKIDGNLITFPTERCRKL